VSDDTAHPSRQHPLALYHLALPDDWAAAFATGDYTMSTRGVTLDDEGFIHCSTREQVEATANRFYGDLDQLVLLTIDAELVPSEIRWEPPAPGVEELFPHIYGALPVAAVDLAAMWMRSPDRPWSLATL
jgi:uncharacterized protein (DUF952 family)